MRTILLLTVSNIFMTFACYGHLKYRSEALWKVILVGWGIAFFEYCFQVPANRFGSYQFTAAQLKIIQEIITLLVFPVFSVLYLGDKFKWNYGVGFGFIVGAAFFIFHKWQAEQAQGTLPLRGLACTSKIDSFTCFFFC